MTSNYHTPLHPQSCWQSWNDSVFTHSVFNPPAYSGTFVYWFPDMFTKQLDTQVTRCWTLEDVCRTLETLPFPLDTTPQQMGSNLTLICHGSDLQPSWAKIATFIYDKIRRDLLFLIHSGKLLNWMVEYCFSCSYSNYGLLSLSLLIICILTGFSLIYMLVRASEIPLKANGSFVLFEAGS
jgi:hypothetical protein